MRSTFWPNRTFKRQSSQNRETGLSMKIVQNALFRSCGARFSRIAFVSVKVLKSSHAWNSCRNGKQCALDENCTKGSFQVMGSTFWPNRIFERQSSQNRHFGLKFSPKRENSALPMKNSTKRSLRVMRSTFWPNRIYERQNSQNRHPGLKFSPKRENSALFMKIETKRSFQVMRSTF